MKFEDYNPSEIEAKWQKLWDQNELYKSPEHPENKKYILDMFPYPSGATMHVGHLEGYVGTDIFSRYLRMRGFGVLHPMGWDAFGLPAENYAIKTGIHPDKSTHKNIKTFKRQLILSGMSYDWSKEIDTSSPLYYKWTQWLFIQLFKRGLAYKKRSPVNWCPKDETVLANEQVENGKCERCGTVVVKKDLEQWFLKITEYADRLISGLDNLDWLEEVKIQQKNWIGKSEGMKLKFDDIEVFTTRPDTVHGATFIAVAGKYEKGDMKHEKEGEFTGKYVINPATKKKIPVWRVNYVDETYGTGAIMGVPAHDVRDREFATKYGIDIAEMKPDPNWWKRAEKEGWGKRETHYHLRDWLISRQRYWGTPIPMIFCQKCGWQPVPDSDLPILLPSDIDFLPHGESPIARSKSFQEGVKCPVCGLNARREVDTMDGFADNSWYFIRYTDPLNSKEFASRGETKKWLPVDVYVGGGHIVQHLLYARFFWKVLYDAGLIDESLGDEPFLKLRAPGWILGPDSRKMSKRWNNVITPDDIIPKFGADTLRMYEMFMGPFEAMKPWSTAGVEGVFRFLGRVWRFNQKVGGKSDSRSEVILYKLIKKVGEDIENMRFNTAIAAMMEAVNGWSDLRVGKDVWKKFLLILAPFAPHLAEELWKMAGGNFSVHQQKWPEYNPKLIENESAVIVVQVNGKVREKLVVSTDVNQKEVEQIAIGSDKVKKYIEGKKYSVIYVPGRVLSIVLNDA